MNRPRVWIILASIALLTVIYGSYSLRLIDHGHMLAPFQVSGFQAGPVYSSATRETVGMARSASVMPDHSMTIEGLTTIPSSFGPKETMDRLEADVRAKGMMIFARIDHAAGAAQAGLA